MHGNDCLSITTLIFLLVLYIASSQVMSCIVLWRYTANDLFLSDLLTVLLFLHPLDMDQGMNLYRPNLDIISPIIPLGRNIQNTDFIKYC